MKIHNEKQGSEAWLNLRQSHFTASDAPAVVGKSKYKTREQLLEEKATGKSKPVTDAQQIIFDRGHAAEANYRPILEAELGEQLFPIVGSIELEGLPLMASFDGITMLHDVCFEHKLFNKSVIENMKYKIIPDMYAYQMEHQLLVSGAEKCIFVCSDGTRENYAQLDYYSDEKKRQKLIAAWHVFAEDLKNWKPEEKAEVLEAEKIEGLPAIKIEVTGGITSSNLNQYKEQALQFIGSINKDLQTDNDFVQAAETVKFCTEAEKQLVDVKNRVLSQTADIAEAFATIDAVSDEMRKTRLMLDKLVKSEKARRKQEMIDAAKADVISYLEGVHTEIKPFQLKAPMINWPEVIKGKRTFESIRAELLQAVADAKAFIEEQAKNVKVNAGVYDDLSPGYEQLFADVQNLIGMECEAFKGVIQGRIIEEKEREQAKAEAQRIKTQKAIENIGRDKIDNDKFNEVFEDVTPRKRPAKEKIINRGSIVREINLLKMELNKINGLISLWTNEQNDALMNCLIDLRGIKNAIEYRLDELNEVAA